MSRSGSCTRFLFPISFTVHTHISWRNSIYNLKLPFEWMFYLVMNIHTGMYRPICYVNWAGGQGRVSGIPGGTGLRTGRERGGCQGNGTETERGRQKPGRGKAKKKRVQTWKVVAWGRWNLDIRGRMSSYQRPRTRKGEPGVRRSTREPGV